MKYFNMSSAAVVTGIIRANVNRSSFKFIFDLSVHECVRLILMLLLLSEINKCRKHLLTNSFHLTQFPLLRFPNTDLKISKIVNIYE